MPPNETHHEIQQAEIPGLHNLQQPFATVNEFREMSANVQLPRQNRNPLKKFLQLLIFILTIYFIYKLVQFLGSERKEYCQTSSCNHIEKHLLESMNTSVNPCENFYEFVCGNWKRRNDQTSGRNFFHHAYQQLRSNLIDYLNQSNKKDEPIALHQAREMFQQCMDQENPNVTSGFEEIAAILKQVNLPVLPTYLAPSPNFTWYKTAALTRKLLDMTFFFEFQITVDPRNNTLKKLSIGRPEKLLPFANQPVSEVENYDQPSTVHLNRYNYLKKLHKTAFENVNLTWSDDNDYNFAKHYDKFLKFSDQYLMIRGRNFNRETSISPYLSIFSLQEITDQIFQYNEERIIYWKRYFDMLFEGTNINLDFNHEDKVIFVPELTYIVEILNLLALTPKHIIEYYMWIEVVNGIIPYTTSFLNEQYNDIYEKITGDKRQSRSSFCLNAVHEIYQSSIAYFLVRDESLKKKFERVLKMSENIRITYMKEVFNAAWLDAETKEKLLLILESTQTFIGYPKWMNDITQYKTYELEDNFLPTILKLKHERFLEYLSSYRRSLCIEEWWNDYVLNVNTFYARDFGAIMIPATILNFPFYQLGLQALEYGAMGMIIGHEMTHAFDTTELRWDLERDKEKIWSTNARNIYRNKSQCFIDDYQAYSLEQTGRNINGLQTLDENLADNEGLRIAYYAYKRETEKNGEEKLLRGFQFSADQLFFLSFANTWCEDSAPEWGTALDNSHSPRPVRILASLRNSEEFANAWKCEKGSPMNPNKEKCRLW